MKSPHCPFFKVPISIKFVTTLCLCSLLLVFSQQGCRKVDLVKEEERFIFDIATAKEWWYGTFIKSDAFNSIASDPDVPGEKDRIGTRRLAGAEVSANQKLPSWKRGKSYNVGSIGFVELPLVMAHQILYLPVRPYENEADRMRVAENALQRLLLARRQDGTIVSRIVSIIPSKRYLEKRRFDLSDFTLQKIPADFDGIISISDWNERQLVNWLYKEGKRKRAFIKQHVPKKAGRRQLQFEVPCPPEFGIVDYHRYCIEVGGSEDEPSDYCDDPANWIIGSPIYGMIIPEGPCYDGDTYGDPCANMTAEQCACATYNIGCNEGDGEGDDYVIDILINDPCLTQTFNLLQSSTGGIRGTLLTWANTTFGSSQNLNLSFQDGVSLPPDVFARWAHTTNGGMLNGQINLDDSKLKLASKEYQVYAILHELYHGYLEFTGKADMVLNDHNLFVAYRTEMIRQLQLCFPNLSYDDAACISWAGLTEYTDVNGVTTSTIGWAALNQLEKDRILNVIASFINKTKGTPC